MRHKAVLPALLIAAATSAGLGGYLLDHRQARIRAHAHASSLTNGDWTKGRVLYRDRGCGACHQLQGAGLPQGQSGPDLTGINKRAYLAGRVRNNPYNMTIWIMNPQSVDPETAMPNLNLSYQESSDIAAYLYAPD